MCFLKKFTKIIFKIFFTSRWLSVIGLYFASISSLITLWSCLTAVIKENNGHVAAIPQNNILLQRRADSNTHAIIWLAWKWKITGSEIMTLNHKKSSMFPNLCNWYLRGSCTVYWDTLQSRQVGRTFIILYNTMDL